MAKAKRSKRFFNFYGIAKSRVDSAILDFACEILRLQNLQSRQSIRVKRIPKAQIANQYIIDFYTHNSYNTPHFNARMIMETTAKLSKWGDSLAICIPSKVLSELDLDENSSLNILTQDDKIIIQKRLSLEEKCNRIDDKNRNIDSVWANDRAGDEW